MSKTLKVYAMYRGDEFIDVGTIAELAERHGWKESSIRCRAYSSAFKNYNKKTSILVYKIDGVE